VSVAKGEEAAMVGIVGVSNIGRRIVVLTEALMEDVSIWRVWVF